jgi:ABC transporter substrate binding protein
MSPAGDPVGTGLVASLARPGANITGLSSYAADLGGKRLETIRAILPHLNPIAVLARATDPFAGPFLEQMRAAAKPIGLKVVPFMVRNASELDGAFRKITGARLRAVVVQPILATREAGALGLHHHIVTMSEVRSFAEAGAHHLWGKLPGHISEGCSLCRQNLESREPGRSPRRGTIKVRIGHQPKDSEGV